MSPAARRRLATPLLITLVAAFAAVAMAGGWRALDLLERLEAAHEAVVGTVGSVIVEARDGEPWTIVTLDVERWLLRDGQVVMPEIDALDELPGQITAAFWGGRAPGVPTLLVAGMPTFAPGERVLWLLRAPDVGLAAPTVGVDQGVWRERGGAWTGADGGVLGVGADGRVRLGGEIVADTELFEALTEAFAGEGEAP